jgi:hypothetical protein
MTLAAFTLLTVARFNADPQKIDATRILLLDISRFLVIAFGIFLAVAGLLVTYPMLKRLKYLNEIFLFRDRIYDGYFHSIEWRAKDWHAKKRLPTMYGWIIRFYRQIIPVWLPVAEIMLWIFLFALLGWGVRITYLTDGPGALTTFPWLIEPAA